MAARRFRSATYPARIAACLSDGDLDLLEERLGPWIDARPAATRATRPHPKIFAFIPCHDQTIGNGTSPHKTCRASIASNRVNAHDGEQTAALLIDAHCERHRSED